MSRSRRRVKILGDDVALSIVDREPLVFPKDHVLIFDPSGRSIGKCCLVIGPARFTNDPISNFSKFDRGWYGDDYERRLAFVDVPEDHWHSFDRVDEITYFRYGELEGDFTHPFREPQQLLKSRKWHMLVLSSDCRITRRGIEEP